jgi:hypothetical protein
VDSSVALNDRCTNPVRGSRHIRSPFRSPQQLTGLQVPQDIRAGLPSDERVIAYTEKLTIPAVGPKRTALTGTIS